jgi:hypothetical protein
VNPIDHALGRDAAPCERNYQHACADRDWVHYAYTNRRPHNPDPNDQRRSRCDADELDEQTTHEVSIPQYAPVRPNSGPNGRAKVAQGKPR